MLSSTVKPISSNRSNLFIVHCKGLEFKCDWCGSTKRKWICFCNRCKKCLDLECAGVVQGNTSSKIPAPEELPKSCSHCLKSMRSAVGSNSNANMRFIKSTIHQPEHKLEDKYADCLVHKSIPGHKLEQKHYGTFYRCSGCQCKSFGPHIACRNSSCPFKLHKDCVSPRKFMMHPFFPKSSFDFSSSPGPENSKHHKVVNCSACRRVVNGYFYQSKIWYEKNWYKKYLHPCCANLPRQIICRESGATMFLQPNTTSNCNYCKASHLMVGGKMTNRIWSYVSGSGHIHLHLPCIMRMLSDVTESRVEGSTSKLTMVLETEKRNYSITKYKFKIETAAAAKTIWEREFRAIMKYAKIALGAIIAALLGDPTTFIFKCTVTINS